MIYVGVDYSICSHKYLDLIPDTRYGLIYKKFILSRIKMNRSFNDCIGFHIHHIYPKSLRSVVNLESIDNKVVLTIREHFFAHILLSKVFLTDPEIYSMRCAVYRFCDKFKYVRLFKSIFTLPRVKFITNGIENTYVFYGTDLPEGYWYGKVIRKDGPLTNKNRVRIFNNITFDEALIESINDLEGMPNWSIGRSPTFCEKISDSLKGVLAGWRKVTRNGVRMFVPPEEVLESDICEMDKETKTKIGKTNSRLMLEKNLIWIVNNSTNHSYQHESRLPIPDGYVRGRSPVSETTKALIKEARKSQTSSNAGRKFYFNAELNVEVMLSDDSEIPFGFVRGRRPRGNTK